MQRTRSEAGIRCARDRRSELRLRRRDRARESSQRRRGSEADRDTDPPGLAPVRLAAPLLLSQ